ncbi:MAG: M3 family oligoendopeptidase, partial [Candidatus Adiutrix sp.]
QISMLAHNLSGFASLNFAQDTTNQKAQSLMAKIDEKMAELGNAFLFFEIWWKELPEKEAQALMDFSPNFAYWLARTRAFRPHTLPEAEEKIINFKNITGRDALITLYDTITNRYRFSTASLGEEPPKEVTRDELMVYVRDKDPAKRAAAYEELYRGYGADGPILGQIYQTMVRDWHIEQLRLRKYGAPAEVRHKANDLSPESVDSLLRVAKRNAPSFCDFFKLKAGRLGLKKMRRYDIYAPLVAETETFSFAQGADEVLGAFAAFSPKFKELAENIITSRRFSAPPQKGKQGGAFCYSMLPADTPWVLMNYNGRRHDLFTMAHELGHGIHSQLAASHNLFHFHATLPLAETASTFGEMLLFSRFLQKANSPQAKADLLFSLLDDAYATVCRQAFFALFEITAHEMVQKGATTHELSQAYMENLAEQFGDCLEIGPEFAWEWVSIPHIFHTPFYVYAYTFGQLLVYSLWNQYERDGDDFVGRFTALLAKGGSDSPENILAASGLGPLNDDFWQGGFDVIASFLADLKRL